MPLCAAWPAWYGFVIEPKFSLSPDAIEAAMPRAWRVWLTSSPRSLDAAAGGARGAVGEGCPPRRRPQRGAEHRAEGNAAFRARDRAHAPRDGLRRPRDHDADRVERGASRLRQHRVGTVAQRRLDDELG